MKIGDKGPIRIREVRPKDFYFAQILRAKESSMIPLLVRLIKNLDVAKELPAPYFRFFVNWSVENLLTGSVMSVEDWLEVSFHLSKQRWGSSIDWLEKQPMSKIRAMIDITERYVEDQNEAMKGK